MRPERLAKGTLVRTTIGLLGVSVLLTGCAAPDNLRTGLGAGVHGPEGETVVLANLSPRSEPVAMTGAGASLTGLDRSAWSRRTVLVPNDATEHHHHFTDLAIACDQQGRSYPTLDSALGEEPDAGSELARLIIWPFFLGRDVVLAPFRGVDVTRGVTSSPRTDSYERTGE